MTTPNAELGVQGAQTYERVNEHMVLAPESEAESTSRVGIDHTGHAHSATFEAVVACEAGTGACNWYEADPVVDVPDDYPGPCIHCKNSRLAHAGGAS